MAAPLLAMAAIPAALGLFKGVQGALQGRKAKKMEKGLVRPEAVSQAEQDVLAQRGQMALGGIPGVTEAREDIQRSTANTMAAISQATTDPNKMIQAAPRVGQQQTMASRALATDVAAQRRSLMDAYLGMKSQLGAKAQADKKAQFEEKAAAISALKAAGRQNLMAGLQDIGGAGITAMGGGTGGTMGALGGVKAGRGQ